MAAVNDKARLLAQKLKSARPAHGVYAVLHVAVTELPAARSEHIHRLKHRGGVSELRLSEQRQGIGIALVGKALSEDAVKLRLYLGKIGRVQFGAKLAAARLDDLCDLIGLRIQHDLAALLYYPRLLGGYLFKGVAEQVAVVEADGSNHGKVRSDYVGTVQTASEPHLEHDCGCPAFGKPFHRHSGGNLEKRERKPFEHLAVCNDKIIYPGLVRHPAASASHHLHPFAEIPDMR